MNTITNKDFRKEKSELVLKNIYKLPSIPEIMNETLKLLNSKTTTTSELSRLISKDQSFVTKVLTIANSPLYGLQRKITSIDFAILILGYSELRNIVSVLSLTESFLNKTDAYLNHKDFWLHSYLTGLLSKRISEEFNVDNSGEAFISGFLHDLGVSIFHKYFHSNFIEIFELSKKGYPFEEAELEVLGIDHQESGKYLMERWNFPVSICNIIANHHHPKLGEKETRLTTVVHLADYLTNNFDLNKNGWDNKLELNYEALKVLNFDEESVLELKEKYKPIIAAQAEDLRYLN